MEKLREKRLKKRLTQTELSRRSGVSQPYINELENGKKVNPSIIILSKLANALGTTVSELLDDEVNEGIVEYFKEGEVEFYVMSGIA
jgi:transcriptional regulator with XRE-family HTH domain